MGRAGGTVPSTFLWLLCVALLGLTLHTTHAASVHSEHQSLPDECNFITVFNDAQTDPGQGRNG